MAALSISDAMGEPFRLIRERPLWVLLWGAPYAATLAIILPLFAVAFANMPLGEADTLTDAESQAMFGQMMSVQIASMLLNVVQIGAGVKAGSVYRITMQGTPTLTGNTYDVAIDGRGYFQVSLPSGDIKSITRLSNATTSVDPVPVAVGSGATRRLSWRELATEQ